MTRSWFEELVDEVNNGSARGAVVLVSSYLEELLAELIAVNFVDHPTAKNFWLEGDTLRGLDRRARLAFALGEITEGELNSILKIAKFRNEFAHKTFVTLSLGKSKTSKAIDKGAGSHVGPEHRDWSFHRDQVAGALKIQAASILFVLGRRLAERKSSIHPRVALVVRE